MNRSNHSCRGRNRALGLVLMLTCTGTAFAALFRVSEDDEVKVASQLEREITSKFRVFPAETAKLGEMARRLLGAGPWPKKFANSFSFWVVEDPRDPKTLNAFAAPGGFICFYKALYDKLQARDGEDAVAAVLAHEIEHAANHHSARSYENLMEKQVLATILLGATGAGNTVATLANAAIGLGKALPNSRKHENESDEKGIVRLWRAGYRPEAMASVFEVFKSLGGDKPPVWMSTHPSDDRRIERARQRALSLAQRQPGIPLTETTIFHRDGKPFLKAGWVAGVADRVVVIAPDGRKYPVGRDVFFDHAEVRSRPEDLPVDTVVKFEKPLNDPFNQCVGVGSVTTVNPGNNTVVVDLGRWHRVEPGAQFSLVRTRVEETRGRNGRLERTRVVKPVANARVTAVREHDATLEITGFADSATDRFSMRDVQTGMEVRLTTWPS